MRKKTYLIIGGIALLIFLLLGIMIFKRKLKPPEESLLPLDTPGKVAKRIRTLTTNGGRVAWLPQGDLIAFDRKGDNGYYDIWIMKPDGSEQKCLTCEKPTLPQKHNGNPAWHPSNHYLAFQAQDPNLKMLPFKFKLAAKMVASPGAAINNNLWVMTSDGNQFWQLTHVADGMAVLHPHFSPAGSKIFWAEKVQLNPKGSQQPDTWGEWVIKIADFKTDPQPRLDNIKEFKPGDFQFYESHGFFTNNTKVIFSAFPHGGSAGNLDLYTYDLISRELKNLTNSPNEWDEHAQISPNGSKIIWASSQDIIQERTQASQIQMSSFKLDFWQMNLDGSRKQRLTYFNDPAAPEFISPGIVTADSSFSPDGQKLAAKIRIASKNPLAQEMIVLIDSP